MPEEFVPDPAPSSGSVATPQGQRRRFDRRKPSKKLNMKQERKPISLKGATPELKDNYFLTLEDDPRNKQDNFRATWKSIGRCASRKVDYPQDLSLLFDNLECPVVLPPAEPIPDEDGNMSRTDQAVWEIKIKSYVKRN